MTKCRVENYISQLGKIPDNQIAKQYDLTRERVGQVRKELGIARAPRTTWKGNSHRQKIWDEIEKLLKLGRYSDGEIGSKVGTSKNTVFRLRTKLGYPAVGKPGMPLLEIPISELGKRPDTMIAKECGCTPMTVGNRRRAARIPRCPNRKNFKGEED